YDLSLSSTGKIFLRFNQASSGNSNILYSQSSYPDNGSAWVHVAATYDGTTMRMYVNGTEESNKTFSTPPVIGSNSLGLSIGEGSNGAYGFKGSMDDVRIYNIALGAAEILDLATLPPASTPLLTSPVDQSEGIPTDTDLSWNPSEGAVSYRVQVSETEGF